MVHIDLFSGIGGFSYALDQIYDSNRITHIFVEWDNYCQRVLKKHWPEAEVYGDIRQFITDTTSKRFCGDSSGEELQPSSSGAQQWLGEETIITGGFPCQPFSQAGRRKGTLNNNGNGYAMPSRNSNNFTTICKGDTTTSVRDARTGQEGKQGEDIATPVQPSTKRNGGQKTSNDTDKATGSGAESGSSRFTNDMAENASVVGSPTQPSSQSTISTEGGMWNDGTTTARHGNWSSRTDIPRHTKSSVSTATTPSTTSEPVLINGERAFLVTGGFPCQPFSQAGRRKGTSDERYMWPEMFRVIQLYKPTWVIAENVRGLVTWNDGLVLEQVCADLESEGYEVQPLIIPAVAVNAPHRRDRVWFIAHRKDEQQEWGEPERNPLGEPQAQAGNGNSDAADTKSGQSGKQAERQGWQDFKRGSWERHWPQVATEFCSVDDGISVELDGFKFTKAQHRANQLKAYGNAIVPQVAMQIFKAIL